MSQLRYRSDIDGLRAVAIIPVVLYHLGVDAFEGGFVGVDVFFVISGFLITSVIYTEIKEGRFSFANFYERRIRRLFPALLSVLSVVTLVVLFLFLPNDLLYYSESLVGAVFFSANLLFWRISSDYFNSPVDSMPLLHTWSLSVEEQFYIVFPILLLFLVRFLPHCFRLIIVLLLLVSFFGSAIYMYVYPTAVFYSPLFRSWELLLGAVIALNVIPKPSKRFQCNLLSLIGLVLILRGIFFLTPNSVFPGINALFPCLGAALIILAGSGKHSSFVGTWLGLRPIVMIGLISYSLYLWHWPLIVFTKYYKIVELTITDRFVLFITSITIALLSWRYIERPFRGKSGLLTRSNLFKVSFSISMIFVVVGLAGYFSKGIPQRIPEAVRTILMTSYPLISSESEKIEGGNLIKVGNSQANSADFVVWGDSHAWALGPAFDIVARKLERSGWVVFQNGCPPFLGVMRYDNVNLCKSSYNDSVANFIKQHNKIRTVVLVGRWGHYANGSYYGTERGKPTVISSRGVSGNKIAFMEGLGKTLSFLANENIETVFLTAVPEIGWDVPSILARSSWFGNQRPLSPNFEDYVSRQQHVNAILNQLDHNKFRVVDIAPVYFGNGRSLVEKGGAPLYRDGDHLSLLGVTLANELIEGALRLDTTQ